MNRQDVKNNMHTAGNGRTAFPMRRKKQNTAVLRLICGVIGMLSALIVILGLLLLILPMFRVKTIVVEGNTYHSAEEIIEASGIEIGQEILAIDKEAVRMAIWESCDYVNGIAIARSFTSVKIVVTELQNVMYTSFDGSYYTLDRNFCVVEKSEDEADFADRFLQVELPEIASLSFGKPLNFANEELDHSYITDLLDCLEDNALLDRVTSLDFSRKYSVSYVMEDTCLVEVGKVSDMETKLELIDQILARKGGIGSLYTVINVSDMSKPTYRVLGDAELLLASGS